MYDMDLSDAGEYQNVYVGDELVARLNRETGDFEVYDPNTDSGDPEYVVALGE